MDHFHIKSLGYAFFATQILLYNVIKQLNGSFSLVHLWISIGLSVSLILWQIFSFEREKTKCYVVLFEIFFVSLMLHIMFVPTCGLFDSDPQYEFNIVKTIQQYGWSFDLDSRIYMPIDGFSYWPFLSFLVISFSNVTGISLLNSARFVPSLCSSIAIFFVFLTSNMLYRKKRVALLATLLFSITYNYFYSHSMLVKESFAFVLFSITIYLYLYSLIKNFRGFRFLAIITLIAIVLSHHFTGLILIIFSIIFALVISLSNIPGYFQQFVEVKKISLRPTFTILTFSAVVGYWVFLTITPLSILVFSIKNFLSPGEYLSLNPPWGGPWISEPSLRVLLYTNSLRVTFVLTIGLLLYAFIFRRVRKLKKLEVAMLVFSGLTFILYFLIQYGYAIRIIYAERFQIFGWLFILPIISSTLVYFYEKQGSFKGRLFCIVFMLVFITMNFTAPQPYYYHNSSDIPFEEGSTRQSFKPQWYTTSDFFYHFLSNQTIYIGRRHIGIVQTDRGIADILCQNFPGVYRTNPRIFKEGDIEELKKSKTNWVIVNEEMFMSIQPTLLDRAQVRSERIYLTSTAVEKLRNSDLINKIYSNGLIEVYAVRQDE